MFLSQFLFYPIYNSITAWKDLSTDYYDNYKNFISECNCFYVQVKNASLTSFRQTKVSLQKVLFPEKNLLRILVI